MTNVLLLGAGTIGRMIATLLVQSGDYSVRVADSDAEALRRLHQKYGVETLLLDASNEQELVAAMSGMKAVISALTFSLNPTVARAALAAGVSYFDLTEDVATTAVVRDLADSARVGQIFMPQCGLAPGFVGIAANHLATKFESLDSLLLRVGALPEFPTNSLKYNLTWSTDGLINEYCNPCDVVHQGTRQDCWPLEGLEHLSIDGVEYEAFSTSGGLGTLCETYEGKLRELNYKTVRYIGHRDRMLFLLDELRLRERRELLKEILENALPRTLQDVVIVFCTATGIRDGQMVQLWDARKVYHQTQGDEVWSAIQITTAAAICAALDLHRQDRLPNTGFVRQEQVNFDDFLANRFGKHYAAAGARIKE
ncbi:MULTISPECIES: saccharopine dehydrogenase NADP-binding domain-containing protein [unclassified Schlesneria]|uniref:saccharopine dehydrogenase NADP-binding domain-containing protein n=1 Tax=unclassified Schlesneria TaxID=2762017 RepID=UPI002EF607F4